MLRLCGAELVEVPALPFSNPNNYQHIGRRLAEELKKTEKNGVIFADQWNNLDNRKAHYVSTGSGNLAQTDGKIDGFICAVGTGGTLAGVSRYLRGEETRTSSSGLPIRAARRCTICSPMARRKRAKAARSPKASGSAASPPIIKQMKVDKPYLIADEEAVPLIFDLLQHEGLCLGGSSGINVAGAIRLAKDLGPGHTIVTVLCDSGTRYQSKLFNPDFLRSKKLPVPEWLERKTDISIPFEKT